MWLAPSINHQRLLGVIKSHTSCWIDAGAAPDLEGPIQRMIILCNLQLCWEANRTCLENPKGQIQDLKALPKLIQYAVQQKTNLDRLFPAESGMCQVIYVKDELDL